MIDKYINDRISEIVIPEKGYVVFKFDGSDNYFGKDDKGFTLFLTKSFTNSKESNIIETKNLVFYYNKECSFILENRQYIDKVHILLCKSDDRNKIDAFIRLTKIFLNELQTISDKDYLALFKSLVFLFDKGKKTSEIEFQGLFAELYVMKYLGDIKCDVVNYWQSKEKMKFDFMINSKKRLEVKSTLKSIRVHHFLNEQLQINDYDIIVVSVMLQKSDKGMTLQNLIDELRKRYPESFTLNYNIELFISEMSDELKNEIKYDEKYISKHIKFYQAFNIPRLINNIPLGIYNISYDAVLENIDEMNRSEIKKWLGETNV